MLETTRILLADDHRMVLCALKARLELEPGIHVVATVPNAQQALEESLRLKPHIVILGIEMPGAEVFDIARTIKRRLPETQVAFLSAFYQDGYIEQAISLKACAYVVKTEPLENLFAAIRTIRAGGVYYSPEVQARILFDDAGGHRLRRAPTTRGSMLTEREKTVLRHIAQGLSKKEVAGLLHVTVSAIDRHCTRMMAKLDIHDRVGLARFAFREGLARP